VNSETPSSIGRTSEASPLRVAVLVAGTGRHLEHLAQLSGRGELPIQIELVISHKAGVRALEHAAQFGIEAHVIDAERKCSPEQLSERVFAQCAMAEVDTILMAGFLRLLPIPPAWEGRVLNIHPSLLPAFGGKGFYGHRVQQAVLERGCKLAGCTVHYVDNQFDNGPILVQRACPVLEDDDVSSLANRVFAEELVAYPEAIRMHWQNSSRC